jgi:hypothetical protein
MTSFVSDSTRELARSDAGDSFPLGPVLVVLVLCIVLLTAREVLRAAQADERDHGWRVLDVAVVPLLMAFLTVIASRITELLG